MPRKKKAVYLLNGTNGNGSNKEHDMPKFIDDPKYIIRPKNIEQEKYLETIDKNIITFVDGPAGTGKTLLSVNYGLNALLRGIYSQIAISRPAIATEDLGYLPGILESKVGVFMTPVFEAFSRIAPEEVLSQLYKKNGNPSRIKLVSIAHMRGLSFNSTIVIVDESQNLSVDQMRMLITRIGDNSKLIIVGDTTQSDLRCENGLENAFSLLQGIEGIGFVTLSEEAIVRHPIIKEIERRYQEQKKRIIQEKENKRK